MSGLTLRDYFSMIKVVLSKILPELFLIQWQIFVVMDQ